jgi:Fe-S-cluster containining protein
VTYPKNTSFVCSKCGLCCGDTPNKKRRVLLLQSDADRIAIHTKRSVSSFTEKTAEKAPYVYEMHKNQQTGMCTFLLENQCSIYEQRPLICRFYPFELSTGEDGTFIFTATAECPSMSSQNVKNAKKLGASYFRKLLALATVEFDRTFT